MILVPAEKRFELFGDIATIHPPLERLSQVSVSNRSQLFGAGFTGPPNRNHGLSAKPSNRIEGLHSADMRTGRIDQPEKLAKKERIEVSSSESLTAKHDRRFSKRLV